VKFEWLNKQGVKSDEGFALQRVDRFVYEYREGERVMRLDGESMFSGLGRASFGFSFNTTWRSARWQSPYANVPISERDRDKIKQNIREAMTFMGGTAEFT
jgi:hypothetical protein